MKDCTKVCNRRDNLHTHMRTVHRLEWTCSGQKKRAGLSRLYVTFKFAYLSPAFLHVRTNHFIAQPPPCNANGRVAAIWMFLSASPSYLSTFETPISHVEKWYLSNEQWHSTFNWYDKLLQPIEDYHGIETSDSEFISLGPAVFGVLFSYFLFSLLFFVLSF